VKVNGGPGIIYYYTLALSQETALWSGQAQCQLSVQSPGYVDQETQTWAITGCEMLNCDARSASRESLTAIPK
jgi:hypothetical protein